MTNKPIIITDFSGQAENPHIGFGAAVGVDLYTTKDVARLSRRMRNRTDDLVEELPIYATSYLDDSTETVVVQDVNGDLYISTDNGSSWNDLNGNSGDDGRGLIAWEDYLFSFTPDDIDIYGPLSGSPTWDNGWWTGTAGQPPLELGQHVAFVNPSNNVLNFCNTRYIGEIRKITTFDPASPATYQALSTKFTMPIFYEATTIGFLPPDTLAIGVENQLNNSCADVVIWDGTSDTTAVNVVSVAGAQGPVKQLLTRNGILYGVTDKEQGVYVINGTSSEFVDRLSLRMSNRTAGGAQKTTRVFSTVYPHGADFLGPELLTGSSSFPSVVTQPNTDGLFPYGTWSVNIENGVIGTRFPVSHGDITALYSTNYSIGVVKVLLNGVVIVGWQRSNEFGIDQLDPTDYIVDEDSVFVESELFEIGTRTDPRTFSKLELNLVTPLQAGQEIEFYWRKKQSDDYQLLNHSTGSIINAALLGTNLSYQFQTLPFGSCQYIQIAFSMKTGTDERATPQMRSVILY